MKARIRRAGIRLAGLAGMALAGACLAACGADPGESAHSDETRAIMAELFESLRAVLPLSVAEEDFRDPQRGREIHAALQSLASRASVLAEHVREEPVAVESLGRSVQDDAEDLLSSFERGHFERTGYLLQQITENCVVCHSRLPSPGDSPRADEFIATAELASLPLERRVSLLIATRRFDAALATLEAMIASPDVHPALLLGPLTDYLTVAIRVVGDFERPVATLEEFARRPDLWTRLRSDVESWIEALPELEKRVREKPGLATASALMDRGQRMGLDAGSRAALAHFIAASSILERTIEARPESPRVAGEAYYLLGITEARIGRNYWVTRAPLLLENAIRLAPGEPFAEEAYARLEEEILLSYEGSAWEEIPAEEARLLAELRALIDAN